MYASAPPEVLGSDGAPHDDRSSTSDVRAPGDHEGERPFAGCVYGLGKSGRADAREEETVAAYFIVCLH